MGEDRAALIRVPLTVSKVLKLEATYPWYKNLDVHPIAFEVISAGLMGRLGRIPDNPGSSVHTKWLLEFRPL